MAKIRQANRLCMEMHRVNFGFTNALYLKTAASVKLLTSGSLSYRMDARMCRTRKTHFAFGGSMNSQRSPKKPADAMAPGQRALAGVRMSTTAQSGSLAICRALLR